MEEQDWFALGLLLSFLAGWFVCWIQMSKSEFRQELEHLKFDYQNLEYEYQELQSENQQLKSAYQEQASAFQKILELRSQIPPQFESQQWQSGYPESRHHTTEDVGR